MYQENGYSIADYSAQVSDLWRGVSLFRGVDACCHVLYCIHYVAAVLCTSCWNLYKSVVSRSLCLFVCLLKKRMDLPCRATGTRSRTTLMTWTWRRRSFEEFMHMVLRSRQQFSNEQLFLASKVILLKNNKKGIFCIAEFQVDFSFFQDMMSLLKPSQELAKRPRLPSPFCSS